MWNDDITRARTLPSSFYRNGEVFAALTSVFRTYWQYLGNRDQLAAYNILPVNYLPGLLDEPLVLTRDREGTIGCLSNVCTHRGSTLAEEPMNMHFLRCPYHGRCFELNGDFRAMAGLEGIRDFPNEQDDLVGLDVQVMRNMVFGLLEGQRSWGEQFSDMEQIMQWFPWEKLCWAPELSRDFEVGAHWMLYIENYLEGLHLPYVHPGLNSALNVTEYAIELYQNSSLQLGVARDDEAMVFDPDLPMPWSSPIYACYWFIFPNMMFNFYPWGISLNVVEPVAPAMTRVRFITFKLPDTNPDIVAIHQTEIEDEAIVERVQRGVRSSFYHSGRYAPSHERAVHHFHGLVMQALKAKA